MTCFGKGATGFTSLSGSEMSAFLTSLSRYPVKNKGAIVSDTHRKHFKVHEQPLGFQRSLTVCYRVYLTISFSCVCKPPDTNHDCKVTWC